MRPFGIRDRVSYLSGDFANDLMFSLVSAWLMVFYTDCLELTPAAVGLLFVAARIWDALADLGVGVLVDAARPGPGGRFRPWLRRFSLPVCLAALLCFLDPGGRSGGFRLVWAWASYIGWGSLYSLVNIPYGSLASVITSDGRERTSLSTWRTCGAVLANVLVTIVAPIFIFGSGRRPLPEGFITLAAVLAVLSWLAYSLCYRWTVERVRARDGSPAAAPPRGRAVLAALFGNRNLVSLSVASILLISVNLYLGAMQPYLFKDWFGVPGVMSYIPLALAPSLVVLAVSSGPLAARFGKKELACAGLGLALAADILILMFPVRDPRVYLFLQAVAALGIGYFSFLTWAMVADVVDAHALVSGQRREATIYAAFSFSRKLGQAFAGGLGALALGMAGYRPGNAAQTVETSGQLRSLITLYPVLGTTLIIVVLAFFYRLNRAGAAHAPQ